MYRIVIIISIILSSCNVRVKDDGDIQDSSKVSIKTDVIDDDVTGELHDSDYGIYHFTFAVSKELSRYSLKFHLPDKKIYVYNNPTEDGTEIQEIPLSEDVNYNDGYYAENAEANFSLVDNNFDGFKDISVIRITGTSNLWFDAYLFDPPTKRFVKNDRLSELTSPEIDSVNQVIRFHNNGGMAGGWYTAGIITWQNQEPVVILEEEQTSSEGESEIFVRINRIRTEDGQMKVASKVQISRLDGNKEKQCLLEGEWTEFDKRPNLVFAESEENVVKVDGRNGSCN